MGRHVATTDAPTGAGPLPRSTRAEWLHLTSAVPARRDRPLPSGWRLLASLLSATLVVSLIVGAFASLVSQRMERQEAIDEGVWMADVLAEAIIEPELTEGLLEGEPEAVAALDREVTQVLHPYGVVRVKVFGDDGVVRYADEPLLIGQSVPFGAEETAALASNQASGTLSKMSGEENRFEHPADTLLEVRRGLDAPSDRRMLLELYFDYAPVEERADRTWRASLTVLGSSLLLLLLLLTPVLWRVIRQLQDAQVQRELLLARAVDASDEERRRLAAGLHDGPVQDLTAGVLAVGAAAERLKSNGEPQLAAQLGQVGVTLRSSIASLRSLLVDLHPPNVMSTGLSTALQGLCAPLTLHGVTVHTDIDDRAAEHLPRHVQELVYRTTRECLRNVSAHSGAGQVWLRLWCDGASECELTIRDDGRGFDPSTVFADPAPGHVGLPALRDLAQQAGASLAVASAPGEGTSWRLGFRKPAR